MQRHSVTWKFVAWSTAIFLLLVTEISSQRSLLSNTSLRLSWKLQWGISVNLCPIKNFIYYITYLFVFVFIVLLSTNPKFIKLICSPKYFLPPPNVYPVNKANIFSKPWHPVCKAYIVSQIFMGLIFNGGHKEILSYYNSWA